NAEPLERVSPIFGFIFFGEKIQSIEKILLALMELLFLICFDPVFTLGLQTNSLENFIFRICFRLNALDEMNCCRPISKSFFEVREQNLIEKMSIGADF